ncbi:TetR/AcrR family transcriptional regulator [Vibrio sp. JC009]|uniref:TetR/AcrR family transcriptional regulator n=1 Tax=Vibrio sp. JC009 TaxID=2912314 RepID=UPI0023B07E14|nr:TetR/AcrR family transcriptional regulator [Vibrio sp. JC009]WED21872.1 TetR/AcrR family transcriptional regulator [Vibrio sp. JC009]
MNSETKDKRTLILNAVEKMIAEDGFEGLSMQKLANEAGVAAGTIYRYFEDKNHLLRETRLHVLAKTAEIIQAGVTDEMSLKEQYRTFWLNIWNYSKTQNAVKSHLLYEQLISADVDAEQLREAEKKLFYKMDKMFETGKKQGLFKPLDSKILSGVSLESSSTLARKQRNNCAELSQEVLEQAIEASWDALINHKH